MKLKLALVLLAVSTLVVYAQKSAAIAPENLAPYLSTPDKVVDEMLKLANLKAFETLYDLGSGDGRIVIAAARKYKANAIGIELDDALAASSALKLTELGLDRNARIVHGDVMKQDYSSANVITVYLLPDANKKVAQLLDLQLRKGTRVVSHDFEMGGWKPTKTVTIPDDGTGRSRTLFLYIR